MPRPVLELRQPQPVCHFARRECSWEVLLVCEDQKHSILEFRGAEDMVELVGSHIDPVPVSTVHNINKSITIVVVMAPELSNLLLASHVPEGKLELAKLDGLDVEATVDLFLLATVLLFFCFEGGSYIVGMVWMTSLSLRL